MKEQFSIKFRELRKQRGCTQEQLADAFGVTVQAVSKWETGLSYPDVELIVSIADYFGVSLDYLLREGFSAGSASASAGGSTGQGNDDMVVLPDDSRLRIVWCRGRHVLGEKEYDPDIRIPISLEHEECCGEKGFNILYDSDVIEIWGSADIKGCVAGNLTAGGSVNCTDIGGDVNAGDNVNGSDIGGDTTAGGSIYCSDIGGNTTAGGSIYCSDIGGDVMAGGSVTCSNIGGNAQAGTDIQCAEIGGDATAGTIKIYREP